MTLLADKFSDIQSQAKINAPENIGGLSVRVLPFIYYGAGILLLIYLIFGGLQLMTSRGDPKGVAAAQAKITSALLGFVIVIIAYFATKLIGQIFGITVINEIFNNTTSGSLGPL